MAGKAKVMTIEQLIKENEDLKKKLIVRENKLMACREALNETEKAHVKEELAAIEAEEKLKEVQKENEKLKEEIALLKAKLYDLIVK